MDLRRMTWGALLTGGGLVALTLLSGLLWLLLAALGDEVGASAALQVAIVTGAGVLLDEILLIGLLALGSLERMMEADAHPHAPVVRPTDRR